MKKIKNKSEIIILGGGCFWCLEAVYLRIKGVESVISGYAGGISKNPNYEEVSGGKTGHAEVVKIEFDPKIIKLEDILHIFFVIHDPTTIDRQGNDIGTQYRSIILYSDCDQKRQVEIVMDEIRIIYDNPIVTEISPLNEFYPAEEYHQRYFEKNPEQAYCQIMIVPKIAKIRDKYKKFYK